MTNKPIVIGIISLLSAFLIWGYQALGKLMEKEGAATFYLSDFFNTQSLESSAYFAFLATTPLYLLLVGTGVFFLIIGAIIQK
jgi:hypothetical protein